MIAEVVNNRAFELHSLLDITNFFVFAQFGNRNVDTEYVDIGRLRRSDNLVYFILLWSILYFISYRCLNSFFRRMHFQLIQRSRLIEAIWSCGFCFGSVCYLISISYQPVNYPSLGWRVFSGDLGNVLYKSFYLHRAGIVALCHRNWMKGLGNILLALFIFSPIQQKWCSTISEYLIYNTLDTAITDISKILLCFHHPRGRIAAKGLFVLHCLSWSYVYLYFVPKRMLLPEAGEHLKIDLAVWSWFLLECFDSVWLKVRKNFDFNHWLEVCLFPPPTKEAIELANIRKKHRESLKKAVNRRSPKMTELWQTLICAMAVKKKLKKMKQAKETDDEAQSQVDLLEKEQSTVESEEETEEDDSQSSIGSEEMQETLVNAVDLKK